MEQSQQAIIIDAGERMPDGFQEALLERGYVVVEASDAAAIATAAQKIQTVLIVSCGEDPELPLNRVRDLISNPALQHIPVLVTGQDVDGYERILARCFRSTAAVPSPCSVSELLNGVDYLNISQVHTPQSAAQQARDRRGSVAVEPHPLYRRYPEIPRLLFAQIEELKLGGKRLEGARYCKGIEESELLEIAMPADDRGEFVSREMLQKATPRGRLHLLRTAFIASRLATPLGLPLESLHALSIATLTFGCGFERNPDLFVVDYTGPNPRPRTEVCSRLKDSALLLSSERALPVPGAIVQRFAKFVGNEDASGDEALARAASVLMAADLVDRICYNRHGWNGMAAYLLLSRLRAGAVRSIHPAVLTCMVKFLVEAVSAGSKGSIPLAERRDMRLKKLADKIEKQEVNTHEVKISLSRLVPGMRLARPLISYSGRELLEPGVRFDDDLIWRVWQLSTICAINTPVVVYTDERELRSTSTSSSPLQNPAQGGAIESE